MTGNQRASDRALLASVSRGDERALGELYTRHGAICLHRATAVLRSAALAQDAVQEAFLDLWRTADRFDERRADVRIWLLVLVHRRAVDLARREARRHALVSALPAADDCSYTAEEELLLLLDRRQVRTALDQLNAQQRELIELAYYGGFTQRELSRWFDIPLGTIKSRVSAALAQLALAYA